MEINKTVLLPEWNDEIRQSIISYWNEKGVASPKFRKIERN